MSVVLFPCIKCIITLCDKVRQWFATGWWFSLGTPVSSNKTVLHDITEILLKGVFKTIKQTNLSKHKTKLQLWWWLAQIAQVFVNPTTIRLLLFKSKWQLNWTLFFNKQLHLDISFSCVFWQHYVIKFVSDLRQDGGFLWVPQFPPIKPFFTI
jgi:hypothetical protein